MAGEPPWRHAAPTLLAIVLLATTTASAGLLDGPTDPLLASQATATTTSFQEAMTWSQTHQETLIAGLVPGAALQGWHHDAIAAYDAGQAWATRQLEANDRATLAATLTTILDAEGLPATPVNLDRLPEAYIAPVATLLAAQHHTALQATTLPSPELAPHTFTRQLGQDGAWLLGALDTTLPALKTASTTAPIEESFPLDPLGMILIGSNGDDTYHPHELAPDVVWNGTLLVIEPGGDDTYHMNIAAQSTVTLPPLPDEGRCLPDHPAFDFFPCKRHTTHPSLAVELDGDDRYLAKAASTTAIGTIGLLYEDAGNDTYGNQDLDEAVSVAGGAASFLIDRDGNDAYRTRQFGFADAFIGIAIHDDRSGDDAYLAHTGRGGGFTHASAAWPGALATLRDWRGDDTYRATRSSYASALGDGTALFLDDRGIDSYYLLQHGLTFGDRYNGGDGIIEHPTNHATAYFLDGNGEDDYTIDDTVQDLYPGAVGNGVAAVRDAPGDQPWGIFVDCETPDEAAFPCEHVQDQVLIEMLQGA